MRAHDRKKSNAVTGVARVQTFITAHLSWVEGYPLGDEPVSGVVWWRHVDDAAGADPRRIDRDALRRATYTITKLCNHHARPLARLVGDVEAWSDRRRRLLALLKPTIHRGKPLPASAFELEAAYSRRTRRAAAALAGADMRLGSVLAALSWLCCGQERRARRAIEWMAKETQLLGAIAAHMGDPALAIDLLRLRELEGARRLHGLLERLAETRVHRVRVTRSQPYIDALNQLVHPNAEHTGDDLSLAPPEGVMADELAPWARRLLDRPRAERRRALELLALSRPDGALAAWSRWWTTHERLIKDVRRTLGHRTPGKLGSLKRGRLQDRVSKLVRDVPPTLPTTRWLEAIDTSASASAARHRSTVKILERIPAGSPISPGMFLVDWARQQRDYPRHVDALVRATAAFFAEPDVEASWLRPWQNLSMWDREWLGSLNRELLGELSKNEHLERFFAALALVHRELGPLDYSQAVALFRVVKDTSDASEAAAFYRALRQADCATTWLPTEARQATYLLAAGDARAYAALVESWSSIDGAYTETDAEGLLAAAELFTRAGAIEPARLIAQTGFYKRIAACGVRIRLIRSSKLAVPAPPVSADDLPGWVGGYPRALHPALRSMCAWHPDPEAAARRVLARDVPDRRALERQIQAIERKLESKPGDDRLQARAANLRAKLEAGVALSPARLAKLESKLLHAAAAGLFEAWEQSLDALLREKLPRILPIHAEWLERPRLLDVLAGIGELSGAHRKLARQLLRARMGPPPWDLRDHPDNAAFLERMRTLGIDPAPWIDGIGCVTREANGKRIELLLEDDPLELFLMGAHFLTCLRPGAMNFFSVFANAADINKRVLYARVDGNVLGRCLLALTDDGCVVSYEPYCHDGAVDFRSMVKEIRAELCARMNARLTDEGEVSELVASDWYDDGIVELGDEVNVFATDSPLRKALASAKLDEVVAVLEAGLAPQHLDEATLPRVLALSELNARPELVLPLVPLIERLGALPDHSVLRAAALAKRAGQREAAVRVTSDRLYGMLVRYWRPSGYVHEEGVELLSEIDPSKALRWLRATRARGVRSYSDETDWFRVRIAAQCLERLHRPRQASRLYQRIVDECGDTAVVKECRERLGRLTRAGAGEAA